MASPLDAFLTRWSSSAAERANKDLFLNELYERDVKLVNEDQSVTVGHIDLFKDGCFSCYARPRRLAQ